jgi:hypothetical protein
MPLGPLLRPRIARDLSYLFARRFESSPTHCETAGKRSDFFPGKFLYSGLGLGPGLISTARRQPGSCRGCHDYEPHVAFIR